MSKLSLFFLLFLPNLSSCSSLVYTHSKFCLICWEQTVDTANNPATKKDKDKEEKDNGTTSNLP